MFCVPVLIFDGSEGVGYRFHVLRSRTRFRRYGWHRVQFSCFALPDLFWVVSRAWVQVFMFCIPRPVLGCTGLISGVTKGVEFNFHVLRSLTRFRQYSGRQVQFSCFALPNSFSAVPMMPGPDFMFCAPRLIFYNIDGIGSYFHVLRSRSHFGRHRLRRVSFLFFALQDTFWAVPSAPGPIFMFCAPKHTFDNIEGVPSCFHVWRSQTLFRLEPQLSGLDFMFRASEFIFGNIDGAKSHFHVFSYQNRFGWYLGRRVQ
jgi:hypothetical protein